MINKYIFVAIFAIVIVTISYIYHFYYILNYAISNDTAVWAQLGDYAGGLLNPVLSFITLVLLIKSLSLQNEANLSLRKELKNSEKTDKLKVFETQFFNMLNSQKGAFDSFKIEVLHNDKEVIIYGGEAVIEIEEVIENLRDRGEGGDNEKIIKFLTDMDSNDQIFGITRRFYIMVQMVSERLSDSNGFSASERRSHLLTLINFTDFALLRLIMISMQFMDYKSTDYLKTDEGFNSVLQEVGVNLDRY